jgi:hypothetical protein
LVTYTLYIRLGAFLAKQVFHRITDKTEHGKRHQTDHQQHEDRLEYAANHVSEHESAFKNKEMDGGHGPRPGNAHARIS